MSDKVFIPSDQQRAIHSAFSTSDRHIVINAGAGVGKTRTIVEGCKYFPKGTSVLFCAFATKNVKDLVAKLPPSVDAKSLHSLGLAVVAANAGSRVNVDHDKGKLIAENTLRDEGFAKDGYIPYDQIKSVATLASLGKGIMTSPPTRTYIKDPNDPKGKPILRLVPNAAMIADLVDIAIDPKFRVSLTGDEDENPEVIARLAALAMCRACRTLTDIDYDDMLGLPWILELQPKTRYDRVIVDECQDMNASQLSLALKLLTAEGCIAIVGDPDQSIYGFRGADVGGMKRMTKELDALVLPLSVSYRCPKAIVRLAQAVVPHYSAHVDNIEGTINIVSTETMKSQAKPGCYVLSRKNAPLMGICLGFLAKGIPACVTGKDIGKTLKSLVAKSKTTDIGDLLAWLETYRAREITKCEKLPEDKAAKQIERVNDNVDCIVALCEDCESIQCVTSKMDRLFSDDCPAKAIVCSSVHRAKGGERAQVFVLEETFRHNKGIPEEDRLWYVAITRTMETLNIVRDNASQA